MNKTEVITEEDILKQPICLTGISILTLKMNILGVSGILRYSFLKIFHYLTLIGITWKKRDAKTYTISFGGVSVIDAVPRDWKSKIKLCVNNIEVDTSLRYLNIQGKQCHISKISSKMFYWQMIKSCLWKTYITIILCQGIRYQGHWVGSCLQ